MIMKFSESFQVPYEPSLAQEDQNTDLEDQSNIEEEPKISPYQHIFDLIVKREIVMMKKENIKDKDK